MTASNLALFEELWSYVLGSVATFLMSEPIVWFTGLFLLGIVILLVQRICTWH